MNVFMEFLPVWLTDPMYPGKFYIIHFGAIADEECVEQEQLPSLYQIKFRLGLLYSKVVFLSPVSYPYLYFRLIDFREF